MSLPLAMRGLEGERGDAFAERGEGELVREPLGAPPNEATLVPPERFAHGALRRSGDVAPPRRHLWDTDAVLQSTDTGTDADADVIVDACAQRGASSGSAASVEARRAVRVSCSCHPKLPFSVNHSLLPNRADNFTQYRVRST